MLLDELDVGKFRVYAAAIDGPGGYAAAAVCRALTVLLALTLTACWGPRGGCCRGRCRVHRQGRSRGRWILFVRHAARFLSEPLPRHAAVRCRTVLAV